MFWEAGSSTGYCMSYGPIWFFGGSGGGAERQQNNLKGLQTVFCRVGPAASRFGRDPASLIARYLSF
jgi:hypothetical protein